MSRKSHKHNRSKEIRQREKEMKRRKSSKSSKVVPAEKVETITKMIVEKEEPSALPNASEYKKNVVNDAEKYEKRWFSSFFTPKVVPIKENITTKGGRRHYKNKTKKNRKN